MFHDMTCKKTALYTTHILLGLTLGCLFPWQAPPYGKAMLLGRSCRNLRLMVYMVHTSDLTSLAALYARLLLCNDMGHEIEWCILQLCILVVCVCLNSRRCTSQILCGSASEILSVYHHHLALHLKSDRF